ncbi:hypothetical protein C6P61_00525 [Malikia spinosa]|uniref:Nucleoid-associated protein n=1 Tax=Malikia spinosa TaxID=86180 RepID=A0A2S9KJ73_9BURK|nr:nucleoid-associated protein [Malikia spinosa]PRD70482.1 hypothetical protein C6P61_00525 [Malikia spinosa]
MTAPIEAVLSQAQRDSMQMESFIFHIIEPDEAEQQQVLFLDEVQLQNRQKEFFLARLREVLAGTQYVFKPDSVHLKEKCEQLVAAPEDFNQLSRQITSDFADRHGIQMSGGVFVVSTVRYLAAANEWKKLVLLVKMDKSASFSYSRTEVNGRWVAVVNENPNSLSESKAAIQKSAVIDAQGHFAWDVLAYDRVKAPRLGDYYKAFLGVEERQQDSVLTRNAHSTVRKWAKQLSAELIPPDEDAHTYTGRALNYLRDHTSFDTAAFIDAVVRDENVERKQALQSQLQDALVAAGVAGQTFSPQPNSLPSRERKQKYQTAEGVTITFEGDKDVAGLRIEHLANGGSRIIIQTSKLDLQ